MSPTAGDADDVDTEESTPFWGSETPSVGDCCFDVAIKVCSLRLKEPRDEDGGSLVSLRLPALRRDGGSSIRATCHPES